jgi:hypothetical protein
MSVHDAPDTTFHAELQCFNGCLWMTRGMQCETFFCASLYFISFCCTADSHVSLGLVSTRVLNFVVTSCTSKHCIVKQFVLRHRQLEHLVAKLIGWHCWWESWWAWEQAVLPFQWHWVTWLPNCWCGEPGLRSCDAARCVATIQLQRGHESVGYVSREVQKMSCKTWVYTNTVRQWTNK